MASAPVRTTCEARAKGLRPRTVLAVEHIRRMRGGAQSQLMRCADGFYYVVKFQNNTQHSRVLVNDLLGTRLAARLGLPTAPASIIAVSETLVELTPDLSMEMANRRIPCQPGMQFGSRYLGDPRRPNLRELLSAGELASVENFCDFAGMLLFDKWTCNTDGRQVIFLRSGYDSGYRMVMIDQGFCFNCGAWNFPESPLRGLYHDRGIYEWIQGIDAFEPWLSRLETEFDLDVLLEAAAGIPPQWYGSNTASLYGMLERLNRRRSTIRQQLREACEDSPRIFPRWSN